MSGFTLRGHLLGAANPATTDLIINNNVTVTVGDAVYASSGVAALATSSTDIMGVVAAITDANGIDLDSTASDNYDGTWTSSSQTYVAAADNTTDKKVKVKVIWDPYAIFENDADDDFADPGDLFQHYKLVDEDQIDESENAADAGQFQLVKIDPDNEDDDSKGLFRISRWQGLAFEPET